MGHSRLLAEGTKEVEKRVEDVAGLCLSGGRGRGRRRRDNWPGKLRDVNTAARGNRCLHTGGARAGCRYRVSGEAEGAGEGEGSVFIPQAVAQFPGNLCGPLLA